MTSVSTAAATPSFVRRLAANGTWAFAGLAASAIASLAMNVALARLLSPTALGAYFVAFTFVAIGSILPRLGLDKAVVRFVATESATAHVVDAWSAARTCVRLAAAASLAACGLVIGAGELGLLGAALRLHLTDAAIAVVACWLACEALRLVVSEIFRGFNDVKWATLTGDAARSLAAAGLLALAALAFRSSFSVLMAVSVGAAGSGLALCFSSAAIFRRRGDLGRPFEGEFPWRGALRVAIPMGITTASASILSQGDVWIVALVRPGAAVAVYGAAVRLMVVLVVPLIVANAVLTPLIADMLVRGKKRELEGILRLAALVTTVPTAMATLAILGAGRALTTFIYGPYYGQSATVLALLAVGQCLNVGSGCCAAVLLMNGAERAVMGVTIVSSAVLVGGGIAAGDVFGVVGVAAFSGGAVAIQNLVLLVLTRQRVGIWTHASISPSQIRVHWRGLIAASLSPGTGAA